MPETFRLLPSTFMLSTRADFWIPFDLSIPEFKVRRFHFLSGIGKLKEGMTQEQARIDLARIATDLERRYPDTNTGWGLSFAPLRSELAGNAQESLWILLGAVLLVLFIACVNVANLLLVRGAAREGEMSLRTALGASRSRILRLLLVEGLVLSISSTILGLLLAQWILAVLLRLSPAAIPRLDQSALNWTVLLFSVFLSLATALVFGLIPAVQAFSLNPGRHLKERESTSSLSRSRFRAGLVIAEIALATVLLVGTGLLLKSFLELTRVDPGFKPDSVTTARISLSASRFQEPAQVHQFMSNVVRDLAAVSGIQEAGLIDRVPMIHRGNDTMFVKLGESLENRDERKGTYIRAASAGYFSAMGIPLLGGRLFDKTDRETSIRSVIVSQTLAEQVWEGENPVGQFLTIDLGDPVLFQVVGIVGSVRQSRLGGSPWRTMYLSIEQRENLINEFSLVFRSSLEAVSAQTLRKLLDRHDPDIALSENQSLQVAVDGTASQNQFNLLLMLSFAAVALLLAALGIYGVVAFTVQQRTREIGVRMALGAGVKQIVQLVLGQGLGMIVTGGLMGLGAAFFMVEWLASLVFQVKLRDPWVFLTVAGVLSITALVANYIPARRAARIDPVKALRG